MPQFIHSHSGSHGHPDYLELKTERAEKFNVIIQDFVIDYNEKIPANPSKSVQKRKILHDDWDWAPYPRRIKTNCDDAFENSGYLSDALDDSQIVPGWEDPEQSSDDLLICHSDYTSCSKPTDIHMVTIDGVIGIDSSKSSTGRGHVFEEDPINFDMQALCEIVPNDSGNEEDLQIDEHGKALNMLLSFTNNPRSELYEDNPPALKGITQLEIHGDLCDSNESSQVVPTNELESDCQIEEFKLPRCFKCRQKVSDSGWLIPN